MWKTLLSIYFVIKLVVIVVVDKVVVGSSHGDVPKYAGEGVASHGTPSTLGVPLLHYSYLFMAVLGNFREVHFRHGASEVCHLICQCYIIK